MSSLKQHTRNRLTKRIEAIEHIGDPSKFYIHRIILKLHPSHRDDPEAYCERRLLMRFGDRRGRTVRSLQQGELLLGVKGGMVPWLKQNGGPWKGLDHCLDLNSADYSKGHWDMNGNPIKNEEGEEGQSVKA